MITIKKIRFIVFSYTIDLFSNQLFSFDLIPAGINSKIMMIGSSHEKSAFSIFYNPANYKESLSLKSLFFSSTGGYPNYTYSHPDVKQGVDEKFIFFKGEGGGTYQYQENLFFHGAFSQRGNNYEREFLNVPYEGLADISYSQINFTQSDYTYDLGGGFSYLQSEKISLGISYFLSQESNYEKRVDSRTNQKILDASWGGQFNHWRLGGRGIPWQDDDGKFEVLISFAPGFKKSFTGSILNPTITQEKAKDIDTQSYEPMKIQTGFLLKILETKFLLDTIYENHTAYENDVKRGLGDDPDVSKLKNIINYSLGLQYVYDTINEFGMAYSTIESPLLDGVKQKLFSSKSNNQGQLGSHFGELSHLNYKNISLSYHLRLRKFLDLLGCIIYSSGSRTVASGLPEPGEYNFKMLTFNMSGGYFFD